jgi:hypothetical protein
MLANTMDPIALLEWNGATIPSTHGSAPIKPTTTPVKSGTWSTQSTIKQSAATIIIKTPVEKTQISTPIVVNSNTTQKYQYQVIWLASQENIEVKRKFVFFVKVYDISSKTLYDGKLAHRIVVRDSKWIIAFDNPVITQVSKGVAKVTALWVKAWYTDLKVEIAGKELGTYGITLK